MIRFDEEMIESLFGYNFQNSIKNDESKSKTPSPSKHVLDPKRLQNITILSKALNATAEQVCDALMQGKSHQLSRLVTLSFDSTLVTHKNHNVTIMLLL